MNNQILETNINYQNGKTSIIRLLVGVIIIITIAIFSWWLMPEKSPYIEEVLSFQGKIERGQAIFAVNCAGCHGNNGDGHVGPSLHNITKHKSELSIIKQVTSGKTPPMPQFQPSGEDMADLLSYLRQLSDS